MEPSISVMEQTNTAPLRAVNWGTMASPMGPIIVDSDTPPSLGGLSKPPAQEEPVCGRAHQAQC